MMARHTPATPQPVTTTRTWAVHRLDKNEQVVHGQSRTGYRYQTARRDMFSRWLSMGDAWDNFWLTKTIRDQMAVLCEKNDVPYEILRRNYHSPTMSVEQREAWDFFLKTPIDQCYVVIKNRDDWPNATCVLYHERNVTNGYTVMNLDGYFPISTERYRPEQFEQFVYSTYPPYGPYAFMYHPFLYEHDLPGYEPPAGFYMASIKELRMVMEMEDL